MRSIYKYIPDGFPCFTLSLPVGAEIVKVGMQGEDFCLWAEVNPEIGILEDRAFKFYATGEYFHRGGKNYIETVLIPEAGEVWHLYEIL